MSSELWKGQTEIRTLEITDLERIERFRRAGYGGNVSDVLESLGVMDTVLSQRFQPLRPDLILAGRCVPIKLHSVPEMWSPMTRDPEYVKQMEQKWHAEGGHPQRRMMEEIARREDGTILCFDCGGDMQPAHFGEMSSQLAYAHGARGMVIAGNCRDTRYVSRMKDWPLYSFGRTPNAFGGWLVTEVNVPIFLPGHLTHYVQVNPGDWVFGDTDGVQVIPNQFVDEVLLRVEQLFERENEERCKIAEGMRIQDVYDQYGVL